MAFITVINLDPDDIIQSVCFFFLTPAEARKYVAS